MQPGHDAPGAGDLSHLAGAGANQRAGFPSLGVRHVQPAGIRRAGAAPDQAGALPVNGIEGGQEV